MVIDDCEIKPNDFPSVCKSCPWIGRCNFTIKKCNCTKGLILNESKKEFFIRCKHDSFFWINKNKFERGKWCKLMAWIDNPKIKWLHQTKKYKNVEFHKFRLWDATNKCWHTYWYLDKVDVERLTNPSKLDRRLYNL